MKIRAGLVVGIGSCLSCVAGAQTDDTGYVSRVFVSGTQFAVRLSNGLPNATNAGECPLSNGWVGLQNADPAMKAALLAAKVAGNPVTLIVNGCENGDWFKLVAVYVNE